MHGVDIKDERRTSGLNRVMQRLIRARKFSVMELLRQRITVSVGAPREWASGQHRDLWVARGQTSNV